MKISEFDDIRKWKYLIFHEIFIKFLSHRYLKIKRNGFCNVEIDTIEISFHLNVGKTAHPSVNCNVGISHYLCTVRSFSNIYCILTKKKSERQQLIRRCVFSQKENKSFQNLPEKVLMLHASIVTHTWNYNVHPFIHWFGLLTFRASKLFAIRLQFFGLLKLIYHFILVSFSLGFRDNSNNEDDDVAAAV